MTEPIRPPTKEITAACDAIDRVIELFISARETLPGSQYEADVEALTLFNLVIRHIEGVLVLARNDMVLIPPAYACARAAFETGIKAAWMVNSDDPFVRETRWLAHLAEEGRVYLRVAARTEDQESSASFGARAQAIQQFRQGVIERLPSHIKLLPGNPNLEEMSRAIGGERLYSLYIFLSQFIHGGHAATNLYRKNLGTEKKFGEFVVPGNWYIAFRLCWLSLSHPGNIVLSQLSGTSTRYISSDEEARVVAAIQATNIGSE